MRLRTGIQLPSPRAATLPEAREFKMQNRSGRGGRPSAVHIADSPSPTTAERLGATPALVFGLVPTSSDELTRARLGDLCRLLGQAVGATVVPHRAASPETLASAIKSGRVQLAWFSPTLFVELFQMLPLTPLVSSCREGSASYHAVLFVPETSPIRTIFELSGKRVAWVSRSSAAGYLFSRAGLRERGLDVASLFHEELFVGSHEAVTQAVFNGQADAGATYAVFEGADPERALLRAGFATDGTQEKARVLDVAGPIPADLVACTGAVPSALHARLARVLAELADEPEGADLVRALFGADRFMPFGQEELAGIQKLATAAHAASSSSSP